MHLDKVEHTCFVVHTYWLTIEGEQQSTEQAVETQACKQIMSPVL